MARTRKTFGPLFYGTVVVAAFVLLGVGMLRTWEWVAREARAGEVNPDARVAALVPVLAGGRTTEERVAAAHGLGQVLQQFVFVPGTPEYREKALAALRAALKDDDGAVRAASAAALGNLWQPDRPVIADLTTALDDPDENVRLAAAWTILKVGAVDNARALRALAALVADPELSADRSMVVSVMTTAGEPGLAEAIGVLVRMLSDRDEGVRVEAVKCVSALGAAARRIPPALEPLWESDDPGVRYTAALAVLQAVDWQQPARDSRVLAALEAAAADTSLTFTLRSDAVQSLDAYAPGSVRKCGLVLARQLEHNDPKVRLAAATLLHMISPESLAGPATPEKDQ